MVKLTSFCGCSFTFGYSIAVNTHFGNSIESRLSIYSSNSIPNICNAHKELAVHNLIKEFIQIDLHKVTKGGMGDDIRYDVEEEETKFLIKIKELMGYNSVIEAAQLIENIKKGLNC